MFFVIEIKTVRLILVEERRCKPQIFSGLALNDIRI